MQPPERPYTPVAEIVAMADKVADAEVDEEMDGRSTNAHTAKWTIIPPKHEERESTLKTTQTPAVQRLAVQTPAVQTPAVQTPAVQTPAVQTPAAQTPAVQTPAVQTLAVQTPPGTTNVLATTAVSQDPSSPAASTSNVPGINATKSTKAQNPHCLQQQDIAT